MADSTHQVSTRSFYGLKRRSDVHLARKIWHMTGVFLLFLVWTFLPKSTSLFIFSVLWLAFVPADVLRLKNREMNQTLTRLFKWIMRENEVDRLAGTTYLLTGVIILASFFEARIVGLSLLFLAFADPIASFVGIKYGKDKLFNNKSLQGFIAAFAVCFVVTWIFLYFSNVASYVLVMSLLAGVIGAVAELIPIAKLDDNLTMPLFSSIGLTILFSSFNVFGISIF